MDSPGRKYSRRSVAFIMALFYVLHYHDPDIRTYSWNVVMRLCA